MPYDIDFIELRKAGLGDDFQRLSGGIREQVKMEAVHSATVPDCLWKTMLKALAEASGRFQGKLSSPLFDFDPQFNKE
jgi:hypothetical protein